MKPRYCLGSEIPRDYVLSLLLPARWNGSSTLNTPGYLANPDVLFCPTDIWHQDNRPMRVSGGVSYKDLSYCNPAEMASIPT